MVPDSSVKLPATTLVPVTLPVDVIVVALTSPELPYITALPLWTTPASAVFNNSSSAVVVFNPDNLFNSVALDVTDASLLISSAVAEISVSPSFNCEVTSFPATVTSPEASY